MKLMILLTEDDPSAWDRATPEERQDVIDRHAAFGAALRARGTILAGEALAGADEARGVRGGLVVEGPYAEAVEQLTGFYLVDLPDLDVALETCTLLPAGYGIEVRPVVDVPE